VSCPSNCVLYFGSGASRGDWKTRSNAPSLAEHPLHGQEVGLRGGSQGVLTCCQKDVGSQAEPVCSESQDGVTHCSQEALWKEEGRARGTGPGVTKSFSDNIT
jgi:hypothetical protein